MKKTASIFLLSLMLFNMAGYRIVFSLMEKNATRSMEAVIDGGSYNEKDLVEIRVPLNMPYYTDKGYEPAYGETVIYGKHYRYVKRKISDNTLFLLCLPHIEKTSLLAAQQALDKTNSNAAADQPMQKNKQAAVIKLLLTEFIQHDGFCKTNDSPLPVKLFPAVKNYSAADLFIPLTPAQPPEQHI